MGGVPQNLERCIYCFWNKNGFVYAKKYWEIVGASNLEVYKEYHNDFEQWFMKNVRKFEKEFNEKWKDKVVVKSNLRRDFIL